LIRIFSNTSSHPVPPILPPSFSFPFSFLLRFPLMRSICQVYTTFPIPVYGFYPDGFNFFLTTPSTFSSPFPFLYLACIRSPVSLPFRRFRIPFMANHSIFFFFFPTSRACPRPTVPPQVEKFFLCFLVVSVSDSQGGDVRGFFYEPGFFFF